MSTSGKRRLTTRLAVLPAVLIGLSVAGGALAPSAHAAGSGTWAAPAANSTVSGTAVALQFTTSDSNVTFVLPYGSETATVSGGVATGTFDSTKVPNGTASLGATECNFLNMCDTVTETVTVANHTGTPTPAPVQPTFSPASGTLAPGATITINGNTSAQLVGTLDNRDVTGGDLAVTLPYVFTVPTNVPQGSNILQLTLSSNGGSAYGSYTVIGPDTTPPVISNLKYPTRYFPVRDGFLDHFFAEFTTNENSTAVLTMYKSGKVVSSGTVPITNTKQIDLRAGDRLKAGTYQWQLAVTDTAGNVTRTPMRSVIADSRHLISHTASVTTTAAKSFYKSFSGSCSTAKKAGTTVVVKSLATCKSGTDAYFDIASARFLPLVKNAVDYGSVTVKVVSKGTGLLDALNIATDKFDVLKKLANGTTTLKLNDAYVGYPKPVLIMDVLAGNGQTVTVSSISVSYVYKTLSK